MLWEDECFEQLDQQELEQEQLNQHQLHILLIAEILHHLRCIKPCKKWDIYHINWFAGFQPSTVGNPCIPASLVIEDGDLLHCCWGALDKVQARLPEAEEELKKAVQTSLDFRYWKQGRKDRKTRLDICGAWGGGTNYKV